nr:RecName: Full=Cytolysin EnT; AltName: Full=DELTA-actitoxin [Entacmaea quadricolor]
SLALAGTIIEGASLTFSVLTTILDALGSVSRKIDVGVYNE